jgi:hypothetical protein
VGAGVGSSAKTWANSFDIEGVAPFGSTHGSSVSAPSVVGVELVALQHGSTNQSQLRGKKSSNILKLNLIWIFL